MFIFKPRQISGKNIYLVQDQPLHTHHTSPFTHTDLHFKWHFSLSLENTQELCDTTAASSLKYLKPYHTSMIHFKTPGLFFV